ncbi:glucans biosynthesis glucosyltransferase MdoH [Sagittula salina]|uniref:Glucans biosynthesis glucosyltransferase H n=1 Tax=Sagittula salina TaxID=2820268 RepID=A0A940MSL2_9RHOB|nr:glucans biosynthesis glucosyltransferase MdoH [Sagittula salina]MBP0483908.1 glucans biosynthesis glucosyltransferase MdoH [Sagittula salina]
MRDRLTAATLGWRVTALGFALLCATAAAVLMTDASFAHGGSLWDAARVALIFITTLWLAWGAAQALIGLPDLRRRVRELPAPTAPTVVLLPICNEDPVAASARLEAMEQSCRAAGLTVDFAVLSDTRDRQAQAREYAAFLPLLRERPDRLRVYYRNRTDNHGRKAGNIEEFIRRSGAAWEFAVILDADSLMEGETIAHMIARMMAEPRLGLLQTLPKIVGGSSLFGRAMMFAASFHSPVFARGLQRLQGETGPFWGHNAIVRVRALAQCCGLPQLTGPAPFGGTILSHDYVEAALLARGGWRVEVDPAIEGSYEEGPDNIIAYARRDRRWCQGNLQHIRLLTAPGLKTWSRFVFVQGIAAYLVSTLWAAFMIASVLATVTEPAPNYFPEPYQLFPVFPDDRTREIVALAIGIGGLLLLPKFAILAQAVAARRTPGFGGALRATAGVLAEVVLSSFIAPVMLAYQTRAVLQVLSGQDGGWPANQRGEGRLSLPESIAAGGWIALWGLAVLLATGWLAPALTIWLLPVTLPMIAAPLLIWATSLPILDGLFRTPEDARPSPVLSHYRALHSAPSPLPAAAAHAA